MKTLEMNPAPIVVKQKIEDTIHVAKFDTGIIGIKVCSDGTIDYRSTVAGVTDDNSSHASTVKVRPGLYIVSWQSVNTTAYALVLDLENQIAYCNVTLPNGRVINLAGVI